MKLLLSILSIILITSCSFDKEDESFILSGKTDAQATFLIFGTDTIKVTNGQFIDTLSLPFSQYEYIKLNTWKWPKLIFANQDSHLDINLSSPIIKAEDDALNTYLLNIDSVLTLYSLRWDMEETNFKSILKSELAHNFKKIDSVFSNQAIPQNQIMELKQIEKLKVAHRTAN